MRGMRGLGFGFGIIDHAGLTPRATELAHEGAVAATGFWLGVGDLTFAVAVVFFVEMGWEVCGFGA